MSAGSVLGEVLAILAQPGGVVGDVISMVNAVMPLFSSDDQATLKEALSDLEADNDEGHARLQEKLAKASRQS